MTPTLLFPSEPFGSARKVDPAFADECSGAVANGFEVAFFAQDDLARGDAAAAFGHLPDGRGKRVLFRSWMVSGESYRAAHDRLVDKGYRPEVSPGAYEEAHYLPLGYRHIAADTARSAWTEGDDPDAAWALYAAEFRGGDALIKDWVKSAKSRWRDGCFLPAGTGEARFREIYQVFREERGKLFNRGTVLREFLPVATRGEDMRGMPLTDETRLFFWRGELLVEPDAAPPSPLEERARWEAVARRFATPFLSVDVAPLEDGAWCIIEVGDGGVSGLPPGLDAGRFFGCLWNRWEG